nr:RNA-directed DNA polymerase, eukaryota [Tanacetum cinerariifolium]
MSIFKVPIGVLNHLESIRQNFFYGVDGSDRKLAWIGWNMVLTSKKNGGLGVSSFFAHNRSLLFKWVWRFLTDGSSVWTHFIKAIFGNKRALGTHKLIPRRSPWQDVILKAIFGGNLKIPTPSPDPVVESLSYCLTPCGDSDLLLEETGAFLSLDDSIPSGIEMASMTQRKIFFLEGLLNDEILSDLPPLELNNDPEGDILFLKKLLEYEPSEAKNSEIDSLIRESTDTFLMEDTETKFNPHKDIDDLVPIPRVSKKPLDF